jgi:MFS family permease
VSSSQAEEAASSGRSAKLPRAVVRLGWVSLLADVSSEMAAPLIPLFLGTLLASPGTALGVIEGSVQALLAVMTALAGWHSDRIRRRTPYVRWGYGIAMAAKPALALASSWPVVLALRLADRFGKGLRGAPRDALIADLTRGQRGAAFGFHRGMDTAGALIGALLAAALIAALPGRYQLVFALTAIPGVLTVALAFTVREPEPHGANPSRSPRSASGSTLRGLGSPFWRAAVVQWLFALGAVSEGFLILRASGQGFADTSTVLAYALFNAVYAATAYPAGRLSDRLGRPRLLAIGWTIFVATMLIGCAVSGSWTLVLFPMLGLHLGFTYGVGKAWIADLAPREQRGTALGVFQLGSGAALLAGGVVVGQLWDRVSPSASFLWAAALGGAALLLLAIGSRRR